MHHDRDVVAVLYQLVDPVVYFSGIVPCFRRNFAAPAGKLDRRSAVALPFKVPNNHIIAGEVSLEARYDNDDFF